MPTTEQIIDEAKKIGKLIAEHDTTKRFESALKKFESDRDAQQSIGAYQQLLQQLAQKEMSGQPIEVADKKKMQDLQNTLVHNLTLREFQTAQMDYTDLLRKVDEAITGEATDALAGPLTGGSQQAQQAGPAQGNIVGGFGA